MKTPLVFSAQRIGIMGGSFNPPHDGHRIVAETAIKRLNLAQLWWLVTPGNPLKGQHGLPPLTERLTDVKKLARGRHMQVTGFEAHLGTSYTAGTLRFLCRRYPGVHFVWVMGADNLANFHRWQQWREIAQLMPIAVVDRPEWRLKALAGKAGQALQSSRLPEAMAGTLPLQKPPAWCFLTSRLSPLSSTKLRAHKLFQHRDNL